MAVRLCAAIVVLSALAAPARAEEPYCQGNPAVVYCNDFETASWDGMEHEGDAVLVTSGGGAQVFDGTGAVETVLDGDGIGASIGYRFSGVETVYVRFYMYFDGSWDRVMHHFFAIHGDRSDDQWSCHGTAGCRPTGLKCLNGTTVDSRAVNAGEIPGEPFFYTYTPDMSCDPGHICDNYNNAQDVCDGCAARDLPCNSGLECCWGNHYNLNQGVNISMVQGRWYAVETMVAANTVIGGIGQSDGEMALWIDDVLVAHHTGILWRHDDALLLNHFIVWNYFPLATLEYRIWWDNLVISTEPIGMLGSTPQTPDAGTVDPVDAGAEDPVDAGAEDPVDASAIPTDGSPSGPGADEKLAGGCGCQAHGANRTTPWLALLILVAATRRRRPSISSSG